MKAGLNDECLQLMCGHTMNQHREMLGLVSIEVDPPRLIPRPKIPEYQERFYPNEDRWAPMFGITPGNWFKWFAWRPVPTLDRGWQWLRPVWKRRAYKKSGLPGPSLEWWQYVVER